MKFIYSFSIFALLSVGCGDSYDGRDNITGQAIDPGQYTVTIRKIDDGTCNFFTEKDIETWNVREREDGMYIYLHGINVYSPDGMNFHGEATLGTICNINVILDAQVHKNGPGCFTGVGQIYANAGACGGCQDFATLDGTIN